MAEITEIRNGARKNGSRSKNPASKRTTTRPMAAGWAKANGYKLVKKTAANTTKSNPKRKRKKRRTRKRRNNGIFGDTKAEIKTVSSLVGGVVGTRIAGGIVSPYAARVLAYLGLQNFAQIAADGTVAVLVTPYIAGMIAGAEAKKYARLGGLVVVGLDILEMLLPEDFSVNPFSSVNTNPIVVGANRLIDTAGGAALAAKAAENVAERAAEQAQLSGVVSGYGNDSGFDYDGSGFSDSGSIPLTVLPERTDRML